MRCGIAEFSNDRDLRFVVDLTVDGKEGFNVWVMMYREDHRSDSNVISRHH